ncbi:hypothetical protein [Volucribacter amazonae]|uniref:DUF4468 domain-containing protein n=1 Tax=Volucribacter amazonae TaxID=256731 RepID=A0A9X4SQP3_9PAST|nr:hypothetical protein [Volucribacter amazonae]MDG6895601.1 hypothetical protein [Volucribacter amazonae]
MSNRFKYILVMGLLAFNFSILPANPAIAKTEQGQQSQTQQVNTFTEVKDFLYGALQHVIDERDGLLGGVKITNLNLEKKRSNLIGGSFTLKYEGVNGIALIMIEPALGKYVLLTSAIFAEEINMNNYVSDNRTFLFLAPYKIEGRDMMVRNVVILDEAPKTQVQAELMVLVKEFREMVEYSQQNN